MVQASTCQRMLETSATVAPGAVVTQVMHTAWPDPKRARSASSASSRSMATQLAQRSHSDENQCTMLGCYVVWEDHFEPSKNRHWTCMKASETLVAGILLAMQTRCFKI